MSIIVKVPYGRGREKRGVKQWAKLLESVRSGARSGFDYEGEWCTQGAEIECEPGALLLVGDRDGEGAALYVVLPSGAWDLGAPGAFELLTDPSKAWAAKLAVRARRAVEADPATRMRDAALRRVQELRADIETSRSAGRDAVAPGGDRFSESRSYEEVEARIAYLLTTFAPGAARDERETLLAERERLLARIAEIDAQIADLPSWDEQA